MDKIYKEPHLICLLIYGDKEKRVQSDYTFVSFRNGFFPERYLWKKEIDLQGWPHYHVIFFYDEHEPEYYIQQWERLAKEDKLSLPTNYSKVLTREQLWFPKTENDY